MTKLEAAELVASLRASFPGARFPAESVAMYETMLADLDVKTARRAVSELVRTRTSEFMPSIGAIRHAAANAVHGNLRSGEEAWGIVTLAIRRIGAYGVPRFKDPAIARAVELMGWRNLAVDGTNDAADRARFCELYEQLRDEQRTGQVASPKLEPAPAFVGLLKGIGRKVG